MKNRLLQKLRDLKWTSSKKTKRESELDRGFEPDVNRTRNLLIWSQTRYHCATDPMVTVRSTNLISMLYNSTAFDHSH